MLELTDLLETQRTWLDRSGRTIVQSGAAQVGSMHVSLHSDYGPPEQDKGPENQDYALAWCATDAETTAGPRLVVAVADGLTDSFRSECAAALACWVAVRTLVERFSQLPPVELAHAAFDAAGCAIGEIADALAANPQASLPADQYLSTWEYMLRKGKLLQTTLMLAWLDQHTLRIAALGDGGALWRRTGMRSRADQRNQILANCDLESNLVHPLGPAERSGHAFDCWVEQIATDPFLCALYTDGLGRALRTTPLTLLDELDQGLTGQSTCLACGYLEQALRERPGDFKDNVTLAILQTTAAT
jgi:serine/threonine protein phosphatase PrpC